MITLRDFGLGIVATLALSAGFHRFDVVARTDERQIVTIEKEKVIEKIVIQHEQVLERKEKEINHVAKQRDQALAEVARLKSSGNSELDRLRQQMADSEAAAQGDSERTKQLIAAQGRILAECGQTAIDMARRTEVLAEENRDLRSRLDKLKGR